MTLHILKWNQDKDDYLNLEFLLKDHWILFVTERKKHEIY